MDYKQFKKVASDKNSTTLQHAKGHTLKVAHSGLSPKERMELSKLPVHKAEGGDTEPTPRPNDSPDTSSAPVVINVGQGTQQPAAQPAPLPMPAQAAGNPPGPVATTGFNPQNPGPQDDDGGASYAGPQSGAPQTQGAVAVEPEDNTPQNLSVGDTHQAIESDEVTTPAEVHQSALQQLSSEDAAWQNDLTNGHVTPETYHSLFEKKDTLGKIGSIFGLILGGAGSGLTHQPNAALQMMNQQINNDLDAQKSSKLNAQNFLRLNQTERLQRAQIGKMVQEGTLTMAEASRAMADADTKAYSLANMQMNRVALHKLTMDVQKLPMGSPQRQQAEATLGMLSQSVQNENYSIADRAAAQSALLSANPVGGNAALAASGPQGAEMAKYKESHTIPGIQGTASQPIAEKDRDRVTSVQNLIQKEQDLRSWAQQHSGSLNPATIAEGETKAKLVQDAYRQANGEGIFRGGEAKFVSDIIDSKPTKFLNSWRVDPKFKAAITSAKTDLDSTLSKYGLKGQGSTQQGSSEIRYDAKGNAWKLGPDGKPTRVK